METQLLSVCLSVSDADPSADRLSGGRAACESLSVPAGGDPGPAGDHVPGQAAFPLWPRHHAGRPARHL